MEENKQNLIQNSKIIIIYGEKSVDGLNKNGVITRIKKDVDDTAHYFYMKEFLKNNFKDEDTVQSSLEKHDINSIFFEIQQLGHIIFAENTSIPKLKSGVLFMPSTRSDNQRQSLRLLQKQLIEENYNITLLTNLFRSEDGVLMGNQKMGNPTLLQEFTEEKSGQDRE